MTTFNMITINLFDHKRIVTEVRVQKMISAAVFISFLGLLLVGAWWGLQTMEVNQQAEDTANMESQVAQAKPAYTRVVGMKAEKKSVEGIIGKIDTLRNPEYETPQLMEDLSERIPEGVWLTSVEQKSLAQLKSLGVPVLFIQESKDKKKKAKKGKDDKGPQHIFIELSGMAKFDQSIVRYMEQLEEVTYLDNVFLQKTEERWIGLEKVRQFKIYCHVADTSINAKKA
ncbi:MAG: PilN domain-containing protein [Nitrospinales bacterium]